MWGSSLGNGSGLFFFLNFLIYLFDCRELSSGLEHIQTKTANCKILLNQYFVLEDVICWHVFIVMAKSNKECINNSKYIT